MLASQVEFFSEDTTFSLSNASSISLWITSTVYAENFNFESLNIIFCSDQYLLTINQEYLQHDYFTDIITFDNSDYSNTIDGDIFISIDTVKDNAALLRLDFFHELHRVIIHGVLHLMGYTDKTEIQQNHMRNKENFYLSLLKF